ncbi:MAG TPA: ABC transporter permease subunit [Nitrososphaerales archaeon]|nr:ABC transporter permease subunit [Nitrososphaerales archaeon]
MKREGDDRPRSSASKRLRTNGLVVLLAVAAWLIVWQVSYSIFDLSPILTSSPILILKALVSMILTGTYHDSPSMYSNLEITLQAAAVAFLLNLAIGFSLGIMFGFFPYAGRAFEPLILILQAFPIVVLFPLIVLVAGISLMGKVMLAILIGLPYLIFNVASAIRSVNQGYYLLGRSIGFSSWTSLRKIIIPESAPLFLQGIRLCFAFTYVGVIVAELVYVSNGLGYLLFWSSSSFYTDNVFAIIFIIIAIGAIIDSLFHIVERKFFNWKTNPQS